MMGTAIVLAALAAVVGLIINRMVRDKRNGRSIQCGCDCKDCGRHCGR